MADWKQNLCVLLSMPLASYLRSGSQIQHCGVFSGCCTLFLGIHSGYIPGISSEEAQTLSAARLSGISSHWLAWVPLHQQSESHLCQNVMYSLDSSVLSQEIHWKELTRRNPSHSGEHQDCSPRGPKAEKSRLTSQQPGRVKWEVGTGSEVSGIPGRQQNWSQELYQPRPTEAKDFLIYLSELSA